ncbi:MAG TPA: methyltransferase domain-containing protein [Candidatus Polarisedimenticolia bacterium]|jgi:ubiquinone/menaquinone biosynthesis C-methylase UbiE
MTNMAASGRAAEIEIMDAGGYDDAEIRANLADLRFYNDWFGGTRLAIRAVARLLAGAGGAPADRLSLLDVATGSGDIPAGVARWLARRGVTTLALGVDANPEVLEEARRFCGGRSAPVSLLRADACRLPHPDRSVDIVLCSNFMHHLDASEVVAALREMGRVARVGVAAIDLMRTRAAWLNVWLLTRLTTLNRLTRHDGPLSVHRAFVPEELRALAGQAGLLEAEVRRAGPVRMVLTCRTAS